MNVSHDRCVLHTRDVDYGLVLGFVVPEMSLTLRLNDRCTESIGVNCESVPADVSLLAAG